MNLLIQYVQMSKLTLSVDDAVILRAKRYAKKQGVSVSKMVESYLAAVAEPPVRAPAYTPILRSVMGVLKSADIKDYKRHLTTKYR
jgi:hypothetical protein